MEVKRKSKYDITGGRFGKLTVLNLDSYAKGQKTKWLCQCDCGKQKVVRNDCLKKGSTQSCGCIQTLKGKENPAWKGIGDISGSFWCAIKGGAKDRNIEFSITIKYLWDLYIKQDKKCSLTGEQIDFGQSKLDVNRTASLDRIDSSKGYIEGNVQWVTKKVNFAKQTMSQKDFIELCKSVSKHAEVA